MDVARSMIAMDPPDHPRNRKLVSEAFTPRMIASHEPRIRAIVRSILDRVANKGECDFVLDLAAELPLQVICEFLGVALPPGFQVFQLSGPGDEPFLLGLSLGELGQRLELALALLESSE